MFCNSKGSRAIESDYFMLHIYYEFSTEYNRVISREFTECKNIK